MSTTYYVVGTYHDGSTRTWHVTTSDIEAYKKTMTSGVLAFAEITAVVCDDNWRCDHNTKK